MASSDAVPVPERATAYRITFPIYKNDGTLISGATGLDSEISKDGGAYADCTNEATEIGTSGTYYLDLTGTEMTADTVCIVVKTTSTGACPPVLTIYPAAVDGQDIRVDVQSIDAVANAAFRLQIGASLMIPCTVDGTGTNTTTQVETTSVSEATADHYKNRTIWFYGSGGGALQDQFTKITAYSYVGGRGRFTIEQITDTPTGGMTFVIV